MSPASSTTPCSAIMIPICRPHRLWPTATPFFSSPAPLASLAFPSPKLPYRRPFDAHPHPVDPHRLSRCGVCRGIPAEKMDGRFGPLGPAFGSVTCHTLGKPSFKIFSLEAVDVALSASVSESSSSKVKSISAELNCMKGQSRISREALARGEEGRSSRAAKNTHTGKKPNTPKTQLNDPQNV